MVEEGGGERLDPGRPVALGALHRALGPCRPRWRPHGGVQEKVVEGGEVHVHGPPGHRSAASGMTMPGASPLRRQSTTAWLMRSPGTTTGMPGG
jgi:hypothetical protein